MNDLISIQPAPRTTAEYKAAIRQLFAERDRLGVQNSGGFLSPCLGGFHHASSISRA